MSLQGTIETFAIADVLRLLAATNKSGRLQVQGPSRSGTVWVDNAKVLAAEAPTVSHADGPADVLFQLLRFDRGSFRFDLDKYPPAPGEPVEIELALGEAELMLAEWRDLERSIPSTEAWVSLARELRDATVTIGADQWRTVGAIGSGRVVSALGEALGLGELDIFRAVDQLLKLGLVEVGARPATVAALEAPATSPAGIAPPGTAPISGTSGSGIAPLTAPPPSAPPPTSPPEQAGGEDSARPLATDVNSPAAAAPTANGAVPGSLTGSAASDAATWPRAEAPPVAAEAPPFVSFSPPPAAPTPPPDTAAPSDPARRDTAGLTQPATPEVAPGFAQGYEIPAAADVPAPGTGEEAASPLGEYPYGSSRYGAGDHARPSVSEPAPSSTFAFEAPAAAELDAASSTPTAERENGSTSWAPLAPPAAPDAEARPGEADSPTQPASEVARARALFEAPAPPPPPAPPLPSRDTPSAPGGWSPASWFEGSTPERLAPPPPPPPPPGGPGGWGEPVRAEVGPDGSVLTAPGEATADAGEAKADTDAPEDAANIERQLFNLSERAREAVKRSSGLFDGRSRR